jgi:hypothetical protein
MEAYMSEESKIVATGTWLYDKIVPMRIEIYAKPPCFASCRYDEDEQLDESRPIPDTKDGSLYFCRPGGADDFLHSTQEFLSIDEAKAWADAQPWGPVKWD